MILEPRKSAQEIDRRLSALKDPSLAELLEGLNRGLSGQDDTDSYTSPAAPYWKRRIALIALAGLFALSAGYSSVVSLPHPGARVKPRPAIATAPAHRHPKIAVRRAAVTSHAVAIAHPQAVVALPAPARAVTVPAPNEALVRQARAQLLHEQALQAQARSEAMARTWLQAEAVAHARAQALARIQAEDTAAIQRAQDQALQNASDPDIKPGDGAPPPDTGRISTFPSGAVPLPMPGPPDTNCTPHRASFFG